VDHHHLESQPPRPPPPPPPYSRALTREHLPRATSQRQPQRHQRAQAISGEAASHVPCECKSCKQGLKARGATSASQPKKSKSVPRVPRVPLGPKALAADWLVQTRGTGEPTRPLNTPGTGVWVIVFLIRAPPRLGRSFARLDISRISLVSLSYLSLLCSR